MEVDLAEDREDGEREECGGGDEEGEEDLIAVATAVVSAARSGGAARESELSCHSGSMMSRTKSTFQVQGIDAGERNVDGRWDELASRRLRT